MYSFQFKKETRPRVSPPAASRFCGNVPFRRMANFSERFLFHRTHFPAKQKNAEPWKFPLPHVSSIYSAESRLLFLFVSNRSQRAQLHSPHCREKSGCHADQHCEKDRWKRQPNRNDRKSPLHTIQEHGCQKPVNQK